MQRRLLIAIILSFLILTGYRLLMVKFYPQLFTQQPIKAPEQTKPEKDLGQNSIVPIISQEVTTHIPLQHNELETKNLKIAFTSLGGNVQSVLFKEYNFEFFTQGMFGMAEFNNLPFSVSQSENQIAFRFEDKTKRIEKVYLFSNDKYIIDLALKISNLSSQPLNMPLHIIGYKIDLEKLSKDPVFQKHRNFIELSNSKNDNILRKNLSKINLSKPEFSQEIPDWFAIRDGYFCLIFQPLFTSQMFFVESSKNSGFLVGIETEEISIPPGQSKELIAKMYVGPQEPTLLEVVGQGWQKIINFGAFDSISRGLLSLLKFLNKILHNLGLSIILLSLLIFLVFYPLTLKSLSSMKKMQALQPQMEQIKKQFKDQPQKMNQEVMQLYKQYKINPFGGCLPLLFQIPVFFALYQALMRSINLRGANFLWIKDLSEPDRLFVLANALPILGNEINLLPFLMAIAMFFQQWFSYKSSPPSAQEQQRMMLILFPVLFAWMFYKFPSGLALYWTSYSIFSIIAQWRQQKLHA